MTTEKTTKTKQEIIEAWRQLYKFTKSSIDFDGALDFDYFIERGQDLFEIKIKDTKQE